MTEAAHQSRIRAAAARHSMWLFRNNVGMCRAADGRVVKFGLAVGSGDLIGWTERTITAADVGRTLAVFTSVECKSNTGRATPAQLAWLEAVRRSGGIAVVTRDGDDITETLEGIKHG